MDESNPMKWNYWDKEYKYFEDSWYTVPKYVSEYLMF